MNFNSGVLFFLSQLLSLRVKELLRLVGMKDMKSKDKNIFLLNSGLYCFPFIYHLKKNP